MGRRGQDRAWRRAQRKRVIANRRKEMFAMGRGWWKFIVGKLATKQYWLGCPDGRYCPFCARPFDRAKQTREVAEEVARELLDG